MLAVGVVEELLDHQSAHYPYTTELSLDFLADGLNGMLFCCSSAFNCTTVQFCGMLRSYLVLSTLAILLTERDRFLLDLVAMIE